MTQHGYLVAAKGARVILAIRLRLRLSAQIGAHDCRLDAQRLAATLRSGGGELCFERLGAIQRLLDAPLGGLELLEVVEALEAGACLFDGKEELDGLRVESEGVARIARRVLADRLAQHVQDALDTALHVALVVIAAAAAVACVSGAHDLFERLGARYVLVEFGIKPAHAAVRRWRLLDSEASLLEVDERLGGFLSRFVVVVVFVLAMNMRSTVSCVCVCVCELAYQVEESGRLVLTAPVELDRLDGVVGCRVAQLFERRRRRRRRHSLVEYSGRLFTSKKYVYVSQ